ncbi:MAG: 4-hydroxy-tetrahydrodipicolinate reductase [Pseudomonadota bacterium]|nr:4-hydroxy-tetrahydrodipicolinate reductase [Pseudomonadota bacterium]
MISVLLYGSRGQMGREILALAKKDRAFIISHPIDARNKKFHRSLLEVDGRKVDIVIDFSIAAAHKGILDWCGKYKVPLLSGTTGLSAIDHRKQRVLAKKIPILWASNMSLGITVIKQSLKTFGALKGFKFEIHETHHIHKKDRPSGTAITLHEELRQHVDKKDLLGVRSYRRGKIFGDHKITVTSNSEVITLEHRALNRKVFAEGALMAAKWLIQKRSGLYKIEDVLEIEKK